MKGVFGIETRIIDMLIQSGVRKGDTVIDFGCGPGSYTVAAAVIAGAKGVVYAVDRDTYKLEELRRKILDRKITNIVPLEAMKTAGMDFLDETADVVLLFDVLHGYYFPSLESRRQVLREIRRVLKPGSLLLVHPTHIDRAEILREIEAAGFRFKDSRSGKLIHDRREQRGSVLSFVRE